MTRSEVSYPKLLNHEGRDVLSKQQRRFVSIDKSYFLNASFENKLRVIL